MMRLHKTFDASAPRLPRARHWLVGLGVFAVADSLVVLMRQTGLLRRLPDPPSRVFDSNQVVTSPEAYPLGIPDAAPAIALYVAEIALAGRKPGGPLDRVGDPLLKLGVGFGAVAAASYLYQMLFRERKLCPYCLSAAAAAFGMVPLAFAREARRT